MHVGKELLIYEFASDHNPLRGLGSPQAGYLLGYLSGLSATTVIEEQNYFDRDYLAEFSDFYSQSSRGYPNICRRLHFFSSEDVNRQLLKDALSNRLDSIQHLKGCYLGFIVLRPIPSAPLGRTVLKWFEDKAPDNPRITSPSRDYVAHIAGLELRVNGLAWQQQDTAVSACATVSLWTMLHSSAFDDHHAIPTTAAITKSAHQTASLGSRVFPSKGLTTYQILEAIKEQKLAPALTAGDHPVPAGEATLSGFSKEKLVSSCAAYIRSGYPVLIVGRYLHAPQTMGHMICAVGFRDSTLTEVGEGEYAVFDEAVDVLYIHDDNIGPNVRCRVLEDVATRAAVIVTDPPDYAPVPSAVTTNQVQFFPEAIIAAVHEELRISSDSFFEEGIKKTEVVSQALNAIYSQAGQPLPKLLFSTQFQDLRTYLGVELPRHYGNDNNVLAEVQLALAEQIAPMSLHIGLLRIATIEQDGVSSVMDVIYDTTDSDRNMPKFAHIIYSELLHQILSDADPGQVRQLFGEQVVGF